MLNLIRPLMGVMGCLSRPLIESISEVTRNGRGVAAYGQCVGYIFHRMFIEGGEDGGNITDIWCKKNINILFT